MNAVQKLATAMEDFQTENTMIPIVEAIATAGFVKVTVSVVVDRGLGVAVVIVTDAGLVIKADHDIVMIIAAQGSADVDTVSKTDHKFIVDVDTVFKTNHVFMVMIKDTIKDMVMINDMVTHDTIKDMVMINDMMIHDTIKDMVMINDMVIHDTIKDMVMINDMVISDMVMINDMVISTDYNTVSIAVQADITVSSNTGCTEGTVSTAQAEIDQQVTILTKITLLADVTAINQDILQYTRMLKKMNFTAVYLPQLYTAVVLVHRLMCQHVHSIVIIEIAVFLEEHQER